MLTVLITLTPGRHNKFIECQNSKICITVLPIIDVKTHRNSTLELLEWAYPSRELTREWLQILEYTDFLPPFTIQNEWTIVKYVMKELRPFWYWTLWMSKRHTVTWRHDITVYNNMFYHMDCMMRALAKKKTPWKEDLFFTVQLARQKLFKYYAEVSPTSGMLLIAAHILNPFRKLQLFRKLDMGMDIDPEDKTSYTTQYNEAFMKYVENEYCAIHGHVPINKHESLPSGNYIPSAKSSGSYQSSFDPYDLSSDDEEYLTPTNVAETTPGRSDRAAHLLTAARIYWPPPGSIWIRRLKHQRSGGKLIQISMITTPTQWRLAVHFGY